MGDDRHAAVTYGLTGPQAGNFYRTMTGMVQLWAALRYSTWPGWTEQHAPELVRKGFSTARRAADRAIEPYWGRMILEFLGCNWARMGLGQRDNWDSAADESDWLNGLGAYNNIPCPLFDDAKKLFAMPLLCSGRIDVMQQTT